MPLPRLVEKSLAERLRVMPAVVVMGARQTGKSTLARELLPDERRFYSLDDLDVLESAQRDPGLLTGGNRPVTLDEVQREPNILNAVKLEIDRKRTPGRFLLTGSANLLLMNRISESLAGRASYLTLWPMTRREQLGEGRCGIWDDLLATPEDKWAELIGDDKSKPEDWRLLASRGGFPTPALDLAGAQERAIWFDGYIRTYLERDLQYLSAIEALPDFRRLMRAACYRIGGILNQADLGRDVALPQPTAHRYLNLLETSYMLVRLPAWSANRTKQLVRSPKLYWGDTGLALHLTGEDKPGGEYLENLVLNDLLAWRDSRIDRAEVYYWRTRAGEEVDLVVEAGGQLLPIEIKSASRLRLSDTKSLRSFRTEYGDKARASLLLYTGKETDWIAPDVLAVPWWRVI